MSVKSFSEYRPRVVQKEPAANFLVGPPCDGEIEQIMGARGSGGTLPRVTRHQPRCDQPRQRCSDDKADYDHRRDKPSCVDGQAWRHKHRNDANAKYDGVDYQEDESRDQESIRHS
jgi:hypothetical protein